MLGVLMGTIAHATAQNRYTIRFDETLRVVTVEAELDLIGDRLLSAQGITRFLQEGVGHVVIGYCRRCFHR